MKRIVYTATAARALRRHSNRAKTIMNKINQYAMHPEDQMNNVIKLSGSSAFRLRVGDFRIIFTEAEDTITILDIGPRGGIYR